MGEKTRILVEQRGRWEESELSLTERVRALLLYLFTTEFSLFHALFHCFDDSPFLRLILLSLPILSVSISRLRLRSLCLFYLSFSPPRFLLHLLTFLLGCINKCTLPLFHSLTLSFFSTLSFSLIFPFDSFVFFTIILCLFVSLSFSCRLFSILSSSTLFFVSYPSFSFLFLLIFILILLFKNTFYFFIYFFIVFPNICL